MIDGTAIRNRYEALRARLDERGRRLFAAAEARAAGYGGVSAVMWATGLARSTIDRGLKELDAARDAPGNEPRAAREIRRRGGGRPSATQKDPTLLDDLRRLLEPATLGDPMRPLLWVSKSHAKLASALRDMGHSISASRIPQLLECLGYRRQVNRKTKDGASHPDRDAQFEHINAQAVAFHGAGQPVISVDTKKKELIGEYKNAGSDYRPEGRPIDVNMHDFADKELGKAVPYGVYDIGANAGCVSVGIDHDTAEFAVNAIRRWHETMGRERYSTANRLMITAPFGKLRRWRHRRHPPPGRQSTLHPYAFRRISRCSCMGRPLSTRRSDKGVAAAEFTSAGSTTAVNRAELGTLETLLGLYRVDSDLVALNKRGALTAPAGELVELL